MGLGANLEAKIHGAEFGFKTHVKVSLAKAPFISPSMLSGFCSLQTTQSLESNNLTLESWIWSIDLREQGIFSPLLIFYTLVWYILRVFCNPKYVSTYCLKWLLIFLYYVTVGCQGVVKLVNQGNLYQSCYIIGSFMCNKWKTLGLWFRFMV